MLRADLQREPRLARSSGPRYSEEPRGRQQLRDVLNLSVAADEVSELLRKIRGQRVQLAKAGELRWQFRMAELGDSLRPAEIL
jgi:hypothetical protein